MDFLRLFEVVVISKRRKDGPRMNGRQNQERKLGHVGKGGEGGRHVMIWDLEGDTFTTTTRHNSILSSSASFEKLVARQNGY